MLPSFRVTPLNGDGLGSCHDPGPLDGVPPRPQNDFAAFESLYNDPPLARESNNDGLSINNDASHAEPEEVKTPWTFPFLSSEQFHDYQASRPVDTLWNMPMMVFLTYDLAYNITHLNFAYLHDDGPCFIAAFALWVASMVAFVATRWARSVVASHDAARYGFTAL